MSGGHICSRFKCQTVHVEIWSYVRINAWFYLVRELVCHCEKYGELCECKLSYKWT